ncbi:hypothetical protein GQ53DRAFT_878663 [Thozetella sp. PMI_491]|nr:hypothetical protein GQ53DRAFT_878663 [Thozetella sp. PMI_491]
MALTNQPRTILGPLTEIFTPPASCATPIPDLATYNKGFIAQECSPHLHDNANCWPPRGTSASINTPLTLYGWGFYSPGTVCPSGWYQACTATANGMSAWPVQFSMLEGETAVGCCPMGFTCSHGSVQTCVVTITSSTFPIAYCTNSTTASLTYVTIPGAFGTSSLDTFSILAPMVQMNHRSLDLVSRTAAVSETTAETASLTSTVTSSSLTPLSTGRLSDGAKAGIGVGAGVGALVIITVVSVFAVRRRKKGLCPRQILRTSSKSRPGADDVYYAELQEPCPVLEAPEQTARVYEMS